MNDLLLDEVEVSSVSQLRKLEGTWIKKLDTYKNGLNDEVAGRTKQEYSKDERQKLYEKEKEWSQKNKTWVQKRNKKCWDKNYKKYRQIKVSCRCGIELILRNLNSHLKTNSHKVKVEKLG